MFSGYQIQNLWELGSCTPYRLQCSQDSWDIGYKTPWILFHIWCCKLGFSYQSLKRFFFEKHFYYIQSISMIITIILLLLYLNTRKPLLLLMFQKLIICDFYSRAHSAHAHTHAHQMLLQKEIQIITLSVCVRFQQILGLNNLKLDHDLKFRVRLSV